MDEPKIHNGLVWEKIASLNISEKDLIDSFDTEDDFINYLNRQPLLDWEQTKNQLGGGMRKLEQKIEDTKEEESGLKPSGMTMDKLKDKAKAADEEEAEAK